MTRSSVAGILLSICAALAASQARAGLQQDRDPAGDTPAAACGASVFEDHFDGPALSAAWIPQAMKTLGGELEDYQPGAVSLNRDGLALTATPGGAKGYVSGRVQSARLYRYGCFFVTARLPGGPGLWPALWLRTPSPINGELDILESRGARPGEFQSTIHHWRAAQHVDSACALVRFAGTPAWARYDPCPGREVVLPGARDFTQDFHTYGVIWTPTRVTWLLDGRPFFSTTDRVPDAPMFIVLNLAVGGAMDVKHPPDASTVFPAVLQIRDVKVLALR